MELSNSYSKGEINDEEEMTWDYSLAKSLFPQILEGGDENLSQSEFSKVTMNRISDETCKDKDAWYLLFWIVLNKKVKLDKVDPISLECLAKLMAHLNVRIENDKLNQLLDAIGDWEGFNDGELASYLEFLTFLDLIYGSKEKRVKELLNDVKERVVRSIESIDIEELINAVLNEKKTNYQKRVKALFDAYLGTKWIDANTYKSVFSEAMAFILAKDVMDRLDGINPLEYSFSPFELVYNYFKQITNEYLNGKLSKYQFKYLLFFPISMADETNREVGIFISNAINGILNNMGKSGIFIDEKVRAYWPEIFNTIESRLFGEIYEEEEDVIEEEEQVEDDEPYDDE